MIDATSDEYHLGLEHGRRDMYATISRLAMEAWVEAYLEVAFEHNKVRPNLVAELEMEAIEQWNESTTKRELLKNAPARAHQES